MLPTIQQIREANGGLSNLTDYEIAQHQYQQYQQYYPDFNAFAKDIGVSTGSKWSNRVSSSIDSYQAGLAGVAEALTGSETMAGIRRDNERSARNAQQFARSQGAVMSMDDIHGVGDAADWLGGLAVDSGPYMVESLAGGMLARGLSSGTRAVAQAGRVAGATDEAIAASRAAERALATRSTIGGVVASYPSSVGDILQNQREEGDATDVGSALVGGVPYAALNAFGLEGAAARGKTLRRGLDLLNDTLDGAQGVRGALARTGVNAIKNAIPEGMSEAGQEVINQGFGRMAVNPDQTLFNDDANHRYLESFVGGAALGGAASAVGGGWRRSEGYQAPIDVTGGKDLMNAGGVPQGRTQAPQFDPTSNIVADAGLSMQDIINRNVGLDLSRKPVDPKEYGKAFEQAASEPSGVVGIDPETGHERVLTQAEYLEREAAAQNEAFAKSLEEDKLRVAERLKARAEAEELGIKGSKALDTYLELKQALQDGVIKEGSFREARVQLAERKIQQVKNFLKGAHLQFETQQEHQAAVQAADIAAVQKGATSASNAVATAAVGPAVAGGNAVDAAPSGATGVAVLPASGVRPAAPAQRVGKQAVPVLAGGATSAAVADISEVAKGKTVTVQNSKKEAELTPEQLAKKLAAASPLDKMRILAVTGMDVTADPTTGKPRLVFVGNPMTYDQVAEEESKRTGKKVSREAIRKALAKFGINEDVITSFVSSSQPAAITSEELGIPARGDDEASGAATGFRVEDDFSKAAGQGLVNDDNSADTKRNRELKAEADKLLKDSAGTKTADVVDARAELAVREHAEAAARDEAERLTNKNTKDILENHPERKNAAADWGGERVAWDKLPDQLKADWIEDYAKVLDEFDGELNQDAFRILDAYQANIEDEYDDYIKYKGEQAATGTTEAGVARVEGSDGAATAVPQGEPRTGGDRAAGKGAGEAEPAGANTSVEDQRVAQENAAKVVVKKKRTIQKPVEAEVREATSAPVVEAEPAPAPRNATPGSVAAWVAGNPTTAQAGPGFTTADVVKQPSPAEQAVIEETVGAEVAQLPEPQVRTLEAHYGAKRGTVDFLVKVKEDIVAFAVNGAQAIAAKVRHIIRKLYAAVVAGAFIFNPTTLSNVGVVSSDFEGWTVRDIQAAVPQSVRGKMSPGAQQAYATILPSIRAQLQRENKLMLVVDKPTARMFVFKPDGSPLLDKKILLGATKGDLYKGNTDVKANRITPAGLFTMGLRDARRSPGEARTAGEYDTGTVFVLDKAIDGEYSVTLFHSVWTKEADAKQRLNALKTDNPADSRYSFGCINVDKETYLRLLKEHGGQMDGAALFIVPESQKDTAEFLKGDTARNKSGADELTRTPFKTQTEVVPATRFSKGGANHKAAYEASIAKFSVARSPAASTSATVLSEITDLMPLNKSKVMIVQSISQLPRFAQQSLAEEGPQGKKVQAFVLNGKAYLVADNIKPGSARAVFLHEVGVHMGLENLLTGKEFLRLAGKIRSWAESDGTLESEIAKRAVNRVTNANTQDEQVLSELIAYFVEEAVNAGVDPTALEYKSDMGRWMRALISALKAGLAKLGLVNAKGLTAQDVVDMAYGAAHLEMQSDDRVDDGSGDVQMSVAEQLGPRFAKTESVVKQAVSDLKIAAIKHGAFTRDLIEQASKYLPSATSYLRNYETVTTERIRMEKEVDGILEKFAALNSHERAQVNNLIRESTMKREWAYTHDGMTEEEVKAFNRASPLASAFRALTPAQQDVIKLVFTHGEKALEAMQDAVMENVNTEFDVLIAGFKSAGNEEEAAKAEARKKAALQDFKSLLSINGKWPYAPLRRFGDHVLVAKSAAYVEAERNGDTGAIRSMEADENHYYVEFFESRGEARSARERLANSGKYEGGLVENFNKGEVSEHLYGGRDMFNAFRRLRDLVNESADTSLSSNSKGAINSLMNDLYLSLLGERSARQSERNRKNTAGADRDMMRAFATKGRADAHFIASLRTGGKVQEDLLRMKSEADRGSVGTRELRREFYNEILARHMMSLEFKSTPTLDKAMAATSFWQLVTSPAYYLQNVTQPWVMSLPMLAGKHGYGKSWAYLSRAYRDLMPLLKDGQFTEDDYDKLPPDVRSAVKELADRGRIEITLEHDLGNWRSNDGDSKVKQVWAGVVGKLRSVNQTVEMVNRLATAVAAVRLEGGTKAAVDYADRVIVATHGDYNAFNAPRTMRTPLGRLATQFRKFQLIQITMYAKLISDAFKGASAAERAVARRALAFNLGHMAVLGGAMGMPGFQLFSTVLGKLFGDDDEPDDAEATLRRMLPDGPVADLLVKGVPKMLGVDVSGRVGSGNMLSLFPYTDWNATSQSGMTNLIMAALGPFVGMNIKFAEGIGTVASGDVYKGMEKLLPSGLSNAIKSTRFLTEGITTKGGDTVMSPEEITWVDGISQLVGLPTNKLTDRSFLASAKYKADKFFDERSNEIKKDYVKAYRSGDADGMKDARDAWDDMQASRVNLGYARQPLSNLLRAPRAQQKREQEAVAGVATRRKDAGFVKKLEGE